MPKSGVTVNLGGGGSAVTDGAGNYSFPALAPGSYLVSVSVAGYVPYNQTVNVCGDTTRNILLTKSSTVLGPKAPSGYSADPVNTATGNYTYERTDLQIPGIGTPFTFQRSYNSQDPQPGPLGHGWSHSFNVGLAVDGDSNVTIRWGDGKTETFAPDGMGGFTPQYGVFDDLVQNVDGTYTLIRKDQTAFNFDASNRLASIVDKNGNTISLGYLGADLVQIADTTGRVIEFTYDPQGRITLITDPIGRTVEFAYDLNGDLVSATDMNGNTTTYTYDADHQMLTATDPRGNVFVTNVYDDLKRVVTSQKDAKMGETLYTYDEVNRKTTIKDPLGQETIHFHDELLRLVQETDPKGNSAFYVYDEAGNRTAVTDKNGNTTQYTYDAKGNVLTKTDPLGNVTTITYDAKNNPLTRTDALGQTTTFAYDSNGNLTSAVDPLGATTAYTYDTNGLLLTVTDVNGNLTANGYDLQGNLVQVTDALGNETHFTYDGVGRRLSITDALGAITQFTYDGNSNLLSMVDALGGVASYTYDGNDNRLTVTDPRGNTTTYAYDVKDLLTGITDPPGATQAHVYDPLDRRTATVDKNGNTTIYGYDPVGNLIQVEDPLGNISSFTYDPNGNRLSATDPNGNTSTFTYDPLNRLVSQTDPLGNSSTTLYDALGRVLSATNAKGQTTAFEYDALGRLLKATDANGGTVSYTYDPNGNRLSGTDPNGKTTTFAYDTLNRLVSKTEPLGTVTAYAYDAVGNRTSLTDPNGSTINYGYDLLRRLVQIAYPDSSGVAFSYDANGNRTQMADSLGTSLYQYDELNRMTGYTDPFGKSVGYGYDAQGNRTALTYPDGKVVTYAYDAAYRLTGVTDWLGETTTYAYDNAGRLTNTTNPNGTTAAYSYDNASRLTGLTHAKSDATVIASYAYTLDEIGNHAQATVNEPLEPNFTAQNIAYAYDDENRLTEAGGVANTFDANGNMTAKGASLFSYDFEDRLVQTAIGGVTTQYGYDGVGSRLARVQGGTTQRVVVDVNRRLADVIAETDGAGNLTAYYVHGLGLISKILPDGTAAYYHYDSRGSTVALTDAAQGITDAYAYDPFGKLANSAGTTENPFKYVGMYGLIDEGNDLAYVRARYYDRDLGRFLTKDPLTGKDGESQSLNRYVYALNRPLVLIDISGLSPQEGPATRNNSRSSDTLHRALINEAIEEALRWELEFIRYERNANILQGFADFLDSAGGFLTGGPVGALPGILRQGSTLLKITGNEDYGMILERGADQLDVVLVLKGGYDTFKSAGAVASGLNATGNNLLKDSGLKAFLLPFDNPVAESITDLISPTVELGSAKIGDFVGRWFSK